MDNGVAPGEQLLMLTSRELAHSAGCTVKELERLLPPAALVRLNSATNGVRPEEVRAFLTERWADTTFRVVAHTTMRGGIGKTTATITTAVRAAQYGYRTCVVDLDPQGSSSLALGVAPEDGDPIFYDIWQNPAELLADALVNINAYLSILPSSLENALLDASLINPASQKKAVKGVCDQLRGQGFDLVIIDCPPSLGIAVISAICAADMVVVPVGSDAFSLKGLELTLGEIRSICETFGLKPPDVRILFSRYDVRETVSRSALATIRDRYPEAPLTIIRTSSEFSRALAAGGTIFSSYGKSKARDEYDRHIRELLGLHVS